MAAEGAGQQRATEPTYAWGVPNPADHFINDAARRGRVGYVSFGVQGDGTHGSQVSAKNKEKRDRLRRETLMSQVTSELNST